METTTTENKTTEPSKLMNNIKETLITNLRNDYGAIAGLLNMASLKENLAFMAEYIELEFNKSSHSWRDYQKIMDDTYKGFHPDNKFRKGDNKDNPNTSTESSKTEAEMKDTKNNMDEPKTNFSTRDQTEASRVFTRKNHNETFINLKDACYKLIKQGRKQGYNGFESDTDNQFLLKITSIINNRLFTFTRGVSQRMDNLTPEQLITARDCYYGAIVIMEDGFNRNHHYMYIANNTIKFVENFVSKVEKTRVHKNPYKV